MTKQGWTRSLGLWWAGEGAALLLVANNGTAAPLLGGPMLFCSRKKKGGGGVEGGGGGVGGHSACSLKKILLIFSLLISSLSASRHYTLVHSLTHSSALWLKTSQRLPIASRIRIISQLFIVGWNALPYIPDHLSLLASYSHLRQSLLSAPGAL